LSSLKTIVLVAAGVVLLAGVFNVGGLKMWNGIWIAAGLAVAGNLIPEDQQPAA
jgi:hypothetical protein